MGTTGFYGLQKLGASEPLSTNDYSFTNRNMDVIDRTLGRFDLALFSNVSPIADPTNPPTLIVSTTGGIIPAGRTLRYKFTWVDTYGNETAASPEATVTTNAPVTRPSQPGLAYSAGGGSLLGGNYFYVLSAYVGINTSETNGGTSASLIIRGGSTNMVTITLPSLPAGAHGFNIFRRGPGEAQFFYLDSVDMTVATPPSIYVDNGSVTITNSRTPLATNLTYSTNSISVTVPGATPFVPNGYTWKLYRTFNSGEWGSTLLEWVVTETYNGSGIITPTAHDYGLQSTIGAPPDLSHISTSLSRVDNLETGVAAIVAELGTNPQGIYGTVVIRLNQIDSQLALAPRKWRQVNDDVKTSSVPIYSDYSGSVFMAANNSSTFLIEGQLFYKAVVGEDFQFDLYATDDAATPAALGVLKFQVTPDELATPSIAYGRTYTDLERVVLAGGGASVVKSVTIHGFLTVTYAVVGYLVLSWSQYATPATPVGTTLLAGSWLQATPYL